MKGVIDHLIYLSSPRNLMWITDTTNKKPSNVQEHLTCFFPGLLALGTATLDLTTEDRELHLAVAQGLTETCYLTYADQLSGVGPEAVHFNSSTSTLWSEAYTTWLKSGKKDKGEYPPGVAGNDLVVVKNATERDYIDKPEEYHMRPEVSVASVLLLV